MIISDVFRTSREVARSKLSYEEAQDSFGYWIDVPNNWESYRTSDELVAFLGIHNTHQSQYPEIIADLGKLSPAECHWVKRYVALYESVARLLTTSRRRVDLRYDLAETLSDWRVILKFINLPARILDFGAGCLRQGVSAYLQQPDNIYTAVDASLAAYTIQNLVFSYMNTQEADIVAYDFLDYEGGNQAFPDIAKASTGSRFHIPTWLLVGDNLPKRFYDLIIAAHVHNELSKPDFMRLMDTVDEHLADDGIFYVRSELYLGYTKDFYDAVDFHGVSLIEELKSRGLVPIWCAKTNGFLTTVFARKNSIHHKSALVSDELDYKFSEYDNSYDLCSQAGVNYLGRCIDKLKETPGKILLIGKGNHLYQRFIESVEEDFSQTMIISDEEFLGNEQLLVLNKIANFYPDKIVIASPHQASMEALVIKTIGNPDIPLRQHYWFPVVILHCSADIKVDPIFDKPLYGPSDFTTLDLS